MATKPEKVCLKGSGNWGSAIARIIGTTSASLPSTFEATVPMWTHQETVDGRLITELINETHENKKYLPGVSLPKNVVAEADLATAVAGASLLVFVVPHQFLPSLLPTCRAHMAPNARAISLIKGIDFEDSSIQLISKTISASLGVPCSVLMGANVASEVARDEFCEATIGCTDEADGAVWRDLFHTPSFSVRVVQDVAGVELSGALKNIVALGAGFCDGLNLGGNTKAAIIRIGLGEMRKFSKMFYPDSVKDDTFFESCGIADLVTTCYGGRNRKCAEAFVKSAERDWDAIESQQLNGQKLQGTVTSKELNDVLQKAGVAHEFPLFDTIYKICFEGLSPDSITKSCHSKL
jgi:glycerol-3-phosphate dehydrogenase (NAD+)